MPEKRMDELWVFFPFVGRGREEGRAHEKDKTREGIGRFNSLIDKTQFITTTATTISSFILSAISTPNSILAENTQLDDNFKDGTDALNHETTRPNDQLDISNLCLPQRLIQALHTRGITNLFTIQRAVLVPALEGRDIIARVKNLTGKALAFGIPSFGPNTDSDVSEASRERNEKLELGTPGRTIELLKGNSLKLEEVEYLVLDEADQMLSFGFEEDGKFPVLVATDIASHGLDIPNVDLVSNQRSAIRSLERVAWCKFEFVNPPAIEEVLESSAGQMVATLDGVQPDNILSNIYKSNKVAPSGIRAASFDSTMPLETRSQDARKADEPNPEHAQAYDQIQQLNDTRADTNIRFRELKEVLNALVFRVDSVLQNTQLVANETNPHKASHQQPPASQYTIARDFSVKLNGNNEGTPPYYSIRRPKREFPVFEGNNVLKWIYKCNQYFDVEEVAEHDKHKLASYYLE
uniref:DEAD/DEAH-box helicase domain-containing protein n=1 Tax=Populus alba TaxID=43335 RepID=A0A4U5Q9I9_POPAL|nr:hypothetical protein D5086_0000121690 [Populus alba]